jgi:hemin uptake protein HemP
VTGSQAVLYNGLSGGGTPFHLAVETSGKLIFAGLNAFASPLYRLTPFAGTTPLNFDVGYAQGIDIESGGAIVVSDGGAFGGEAHVYRVDPVSGARSTVSSGGLLAGTGTIAVAADGDLYVTEQTAIIRVSPITGAQSVVSSGNLFQGIGGIAFYGSGVTPTKKETFGSVKVRYR